MEKDLFFSKESHSRPRPTYAMSGYIKRRIENGFPDKNVITCKSGLVIKWNRNRWAKDDFGGNYVQVRSLVAGFYLDGELVGGASFNETRNPFDDWLDSNAYLDSCDEASQSLCNHAEIALMSLEKFFDREGELNPREAFVEIECLNMLPVAKGELVWKEALTTILSSIYAKDKSFVVAMLKPFPLEYENHFDEREQRLSDANGTRQQHLLNRRTKALSRLYMKHLGFVEVEEGKTSWLVKDMDDFRKRKPSNSRASVYSGVSLSPQCF